MAVLELVIFAGPKKKDIVEDGAKRTVIGLPFDLRFRTYSLQGPEWVCMVKAEETRPTMKDGDSFVLKGLAYLGDQHGGPTTAEIAGSPRMPHRIVGYYDSKKESGLFLYER